MVTANAGRDRTIGAANAAVPAQGGLADEVTPGDAVVARLRDQQTTLLELRERVLDQLHVHGLAQAGARDRGKVGERGAPVGAGEDDRSER